MFDLAVWQDALTTHWHVWLVTVTIIVMAVMNGFRKDLFSKILGLNGHVIVYKIGEPFTACHRTCSSAACILHARSPKYAALSAIGPACGSDADNHYTNYTVTTLFGRP